MFTLLFAFHFIACMHILSKENITGTSKTLAVFFLPFYQKFTLMLMSMYFDRQTIVSVIGCIYLCNAKVHLIQVQQNGMCLNCYDNVMDTISLKKYKSKNTYSFTQVSTYCIIYFTTTKYHFNILTSP